MQWDGDPGGGEGDEEGLGLLDIASDPGPSTPSSLLPTSQLSWGLCPWAARLAPGMELEAAPPHPSSPWPCLYLSSKNLPWEPLVLLWE